MTGLSIVPVSLPALSCSDGSLAAAADELLPWRPAGRAGTPWLSLCCLRHSTEAQAAPDVTFCAVSCERELSAEARARPSPAPGLCRDEPRRR